MRHSPLKKTSSRQKLINECLNIIRKTLILERGNKCEICGRTANNLGLFHILPRGRYPRLTLNTFNLLLSCWFPCHHLWHSSFFEAPQIEKRIKELRGEDYKEKLLVLDKTAPKLTMVYLQTYLEGLKNV